MLDRSARFATSPRVCCDHHNWNWIGIYYRISHFSSSLYSIFLGFDKNPANVVYDVGSMVDFLIFSGSLYHCWFHSSRWFPFITPDVSKVVRGVKTMIVTILLQKCPLICLHDPRPRTSFCDILVLDNACVFLSWSTVANIDQLLYWPR